MKDASPNKVKIWLSSKEYIEASKGANLRLALKGNFHKLYNGLAKNFHCRGLGTCGTCSVLVEGPASEPSKREKWRLNFHPHKNSLDKGLRLACQTKVLGDIKIKKYEGLWGNKNLP